MFLRDALRVESLGRSDDLDLEWVVNVADVEPGGSYREWLRRTDNLAILFSELIDTSIMAGLMAVEHADGSEIFTTLSWSRRSIQYLDHGRQRGAL